MFLPFTGPQKETPDGAVKAPFLEARAGFPATGAAVLKAERLNPGTETSAVLTCTAPPNIQPACLGPVARLSAKGYIHYRLPRYPAQSEGFAWLNRLG